MYLPSDILGPYKAKTPGFLPVFGGRRVRAVEGAFGEAGKPASYGMDKERVNGSF